MANLTPRQARLGMFSFLALCFGVITNMLFLQSPAPDAWSQRTAGRPGPSVWTPPKEQEGAWKTRVRTKGRQQGRAANPGTPSQGAALQQRPSRKVQVSKTPTGALAPAQSGTVRAIQRELSSRGYLAGQIDGVAGLMTRAAIMAFEYDQGLELTATPTQSLLHHILLGQRASGPVRRNPASRYHPNVKRVVVAVQGRLAALGYLRGGTHGTLSETTARAIREFELDHGLIATGRVSGQLVAALARASRRTSRRR